MKRTATEAVVDELPIDSIRIGNRFRQHMGDISGLAASIAAHGLLHPIVVTPERTLIAGERRLMAVRQLGWTDVPVRVVAPANLLQAETDENAVRADFTPSEAVAIAKALEPVERAAAKARQGERIDLTSAQFAQKSAGRSADRVAAAVGLGARTLAKAAAVVEAAEEDPDLGDLVADMDASGSVDRAFRELAKRTKPSAPLEMNDVHRQKFPELAYSELRSELITAIRAFGKPGAFEPESWADRVPQLRPEELAQLRSHLGYVRRWLDKWDRLIDRPALALVEGQAE